MVDLQGGNIARMQNALAGFSSAGKTHADIAGIAQRSNQADADRFAAMLGQGFGNLAESFAQDKAAASALEQIQAQAEAEILASGGTDLNIKTALENLRAGNVLERDEAQGAKSIEELTARLSQDTEMSKLDRQLQRDLAALDSDDSRYTDKQRLAIANLNLAAAELRENGYENGLAHAKTIRDMVEAGAGQAFFIKDIDGDYTPDINSYLEQTEGDRPEAFRLWRQALEIEIEPTLAGYLEGSAGMSDMSVEDTAHLRNMVFLQWALPREAPADTGGGGGGGQDYSGSLLRTPTKPLGIAPGVVPPVGVEGGYVNLFNAPITADDPIFGGLVREGQRRVQANTDAESAFAEFRETWSNLTPERLKSLDLSWKENLSPEEEDVAQRIVTAMDGLSQSNVPQKHGDWQQLEKWLQEMYFAPGHGLVRAKSAPGAIGRQLKTIENRLNEGSY